MLDPGAVIEAQLPGQEAPAQYTVVRCSASMLSVHLQELGGEAVHRVSLKKLPFTTVRLPGEEPQDGAAAAAEAGGSSGSDGEEEQEEEEEDGAAGGGDADADPAERHTAEGGSDEEGGSASDGDAEEDGEEEEQEEEATLDAFPTSTAAAVEAFAAAVESDPAAFLQPTAELAALAKSAAKALYDYQAALDSSSTAGGTGSGTGSGTGGLPELYVDGFDAEQIWLQLELAAGPALKRARKLLKKAGQEPELLTPETEEAIDELLEGQAGDSSSEDGEGSDALSGSEGSEGKGDDEAYDSEDDELAGADVADAADLADLDYDALLAAGAAHQRRRKTAVAAAAGGSDSEGEDGEDAAAAAAAKLAGSKRKRAGKAAAARAKVEDEHFKLDEMEAFLQQAERVEAGLEDEGAEGGEEDEEEGDGGSDAEEAELEALLNEEVALAGRDKKKAKKAKKKRKGAFGGQGDEEDEEGEGVGPSAMFEDFFGPRGGRQGPTTVEAGSGRRPQDAFQEAGFQEDQEEREGEEEEEDSAEEEDKDEDGFEDDLLSDDMMSGEEEKEGDGKAGGKAGRQNKRVLANGAAGRGREEEEEEEEEEDDGRYDFDEYEEPEGEAWRAPQGSRRAALAESEEEEDEAEEEEEQRPSAHERRQHRMQDRISKLEEVAMGEKTWFMRGEVDAGKRPKNSALEVDMDFDTTVKPPPQPTEEMTMTLDELIKKRIADARFDDVPRVVAPPPDKKRTTLELDDSKPQQGLGEIYEAEYMQTVAGVADDKDEDLRQSARAQFSALAIKLDALSHMNFTPRPVIEEITVKVDVPAIMMEEAAPQFVSGASMQAPEEVFATQAKGAPQAEEELSREERKQRRAQKKRAGKKRRASKDEERAARAVSQGGTAALSGRKSAAEEEAKRAMEKAAKKQQRRSGPSSDAPSKRGEYNKSAAVFARIQQHTDGTTAAAAALAATAVAPRASHLKL